MHIVKKTFIVLAVAFMAFFTWAFTSNDFELAKHLDIYYTTVKEVLINYVDDVDPGELIENSIHGMLIKLDPYTNYIPENSIENYRVMTTGEYGGLGAFFRQKDGKSYIVEIHEDGPAMKAGLKPGDIILQVNGKDIANRTYQEIEDMFLGQPGTSIRITIESPGTEGTRELEVIREKIEMKSVPHYEILPNGIAYINLSSFTMKAFAEVNAALDVMKAKDTLKGVILDLRGNPGGLLMEAVRIVNLFVPKGQEVVSTRGKVSVHNKVFNTMVEPTYPNLPVVVLVNSSSASASEIVAGCLQDLDRAVVMGTRTFGKGLVQQTIDLSYNSKLKITTSKYYIPSGRCIQALDYSHKNPDGSVAHVPDSLMKTFYTKNGRVVKDGGGILPDFNLPADTLSPLVRALITEELFFNYVTRYALNTKEIADPEEFYVTQDVLRDFSDFVQISGFTYETESQKKFKAWRESLTKDEMSALGQSQVLAFEKIMPQNIKSLILKESAQVENVLANELMLRFHKKSGQINYKIHHDPLVQEASKVLYDTLTYHQIFRP
ncbi:MAG: S41 family peptidase [Bacteroidales bacterium]|nr:S41 family peptidase [Bacteroidales bacterium]